MQQSNKDEKKTVKSSVTVVNSCKVFKQKNFVKSADEIKLVLVNNLGLWFSSLFVAEVEAEQLVYGALTAILGLIWDR